MSTTLGRIRVAWTGFPGGPGVSTFYATDPLSFVGPLRTFFDSIKTLLPTDVTIQVPGAGDMVDDGTGNLIGSWTTATPAAVVGTSVAVYAAPNGLCVDWLTGTVRGKRRMQGRTFVVPVTTAFMQSDGQPSSAARTTLGNAGTTLVGSASTAGWRIWGRPKVGSAGTSALVTSARVPTFWVVLRSRRD